MKERGFTLLEVLVAMSLLGIIAAAMVPGIINRSTLNTFTEIKTEAVQAGQVVLDGLRISNISALPTSGSDSAQDVDIGNRTYQVVISYCAMTEYCPPTVSSNTRHLKAEIFLDGEMIYELQTVFTKLQ